jgi:DNA modification methylase
MTSPPYFGLRDYGDDGQIGLEDSLDAYISELMAMFDELRRVVRDDGSVWLNLGDSYGDRKQKLLVPHRVAIELQEAGWIVRNDVTWVKPNPMPSSVKDRLNTTTEQVFHLTPASDYWYNLDAIREPHAESSHERMKSDAPVKPTPERDLEQAHAQSGGVNEDGNLHPAGKNPGDVFQVATKPFSDAHFAVYPPELCEKPLKATCPPTVCAECGAPYERTEIEDETVPTPNTDRKQGRRALELFEDSDLSHQHLRALRSVGVTDAGQAQEVYDGHGNNTKPVERMAAKAKDVLGGYAREFLGEVRGETEWEQACDCDTDETQPGVALDPFAGAGTTCLVAKRLGRRFIGIDISEEYVAMAQSRVGVTVDQPALIQDDSAQATLRQFEAATDGGEELADNSD